MRTSRHYWLGPEPRIVNDETVMRAGGPPDGWQSTLRHFLTARINETVTAIQKGILTAAGKLTERHVRVS